MKILVIGLGSMGKRRIRLLKQLAQAEVIVGVDLSEERRLAAEDEFGIKTFDKLEMATGQSAYDCAFICTAPLTHGELIAKCLEGKMHIFSELNLVSDGYVENLERARQNECVLFLSSTMLYRKETEKIRALVQGADCALSYSYHIGQYLPDWHPWECYQSFFVNEVRSNGCREIFAIELPWLMSAFGNIQDFHVVKGKMSKLEINYPDTYQLLITHENGHRGTLMVDVVSRKAVRNLEVYGEQLHLMWDGSPEGLSLYDYASKMTQKVDLYDQVERQAGYSNFVVENAYLREIELFFKAINERIMPTYTFETDLAVLELIDRIEA